MDKKITVSSGTPLASKRADRAFKLEKSLISKKESINLNFLDIGKILSEIKAKRLFVELGFDNATDWLSTLGISIRVAWYLISVYEFFVLDKKLPTSALKDIDVTKLFDILPAVKKDTKNFDDWLEKAKVLRTADLRKELKEFKLKEERKVIAEPIDTDIETEVKKNSDKNVILCGDMYKQLKTLKEDTVDCVIVTPPKTYNYGLIYWMLRTLKKNGHMLFFCNARDLHSVINDFGRTGVRLARVIVWKKTHFSKPASLNELGHEHELILYGSRCDLLAPVGKKLMRVPPKVNYNLTEFRGDVWEFEPKIKLGHDDEKPVALLEELIEMSTNPGDLILNPFSGSGGVLAAAKRTGRRFLGVEEDKYWHKVSLKRVDDVSML